jgi:Ran GTPase-activating protein (RanGAP) involved in mRNA processing and transport
MEASFLQGAAAFARSLRVVNEHLTSLDLGFNEIRDKGAFALAQALKANGEAAVTTLNLTSNFFTKYGQVALTEAKEHISEMNDGKEVNIYF